MATNVNIFWFTGIIAFLFIGLSLWISWSIWKERKSFIASWKCLNSFERWSVKLGLLIFFFMPILSKHPAKDEYLPKVLSELLYETGKAIFIFGIISLLQYLHGKHGRDKRTEESGEDRQIAASVKSGSSNTEPVRFISPFLRRRLVWPLLIGIAGSLVAAWFCSAGGFFVNLGTTFIGILLTVGYVDLVLRNHEARKWSTALHRIQSRLDNFTGVAINQFRAAFKVPYDVYDEKLLNTGSDHDRRTELVRVAKTILAPTADKGLASLDEKGWKYLVNQLQITWTSADRLIELHGAQLGPDAIADLLDIQNSMWSMIQAHCTFPDILGVQPDRLQPNRHGKSSVPLQDCLLEKAAKDTRDILDLAISLIERADALV